jgi:S-sulfo-L-cysteine synthase (3-phospho-L-serine-dependent)
MRAGAFAVWARAGLRVVLADGSSQAHYEHVVDEYEAFEVRDARTPDVDRLERLGSRCDGVTTLSDASILTAATLAERLGLPGPGVHAARLSRSKPEQRKLAGSHGIGSPRWAVVRSPEDVDAFFAHGNVAAVLKPADAAASTAVYPVGNADEARARWPEVKPFSETSTGVLEERVFGPEVSVEGVVSRGRLEAASVTRKRLGGPTGFLERAHLVVRDEDESLVEAATAAAAAVVSAWRVDSALVHVELKLPLAGEPVLVEAAARVGGDLIPELVRKALGRDLYRVQAALAFGEVPPPDDAPAAACAGISFLLASGAVRRTVAPVEVLDGLADVHVVEQLVPSGRRLPPLVANWTRAGYALGWGDSPESLEADLARAATRLAELMGVEEHGSAES